MSRLIAAVEANDIEIVKLLEKKENINMKLKH